MCCLRLRPDHFDDDAVARFWQRLPQDQIQLGSRPVVRRVRPCLPPRLRLPAPARLPTRPRAVGDHPGPREPVIVMTATDTVIDARDVAPIGSRRLRHDAPGRWIVPPHPGHPRSGERRPPRVHPPRPATTTLVALAVAAMPGEWRDHSRSRTGAHPVRGEPRGRRQRGGVRDRRRDGRHQDDPRGPRRGGPMRVSPCACAPRSPPLHDTSPRVRAAPRRENIASGTTNSNRRES